MQRLAVASATHNGDAETFSFTALSLPMTAIITGIQVRVRANDAARTDHKLRISLSSNGTTFTAPLATRNFRRGSALTDYVVGGSTVLWGRTWTAADITGPNFRVRALAPKANTANKTNLDCIPVTVFYELPGAPNLNLSKSDSPDPVQPGQNITYTIAYSNTGASAATSVVISDATPRRPTPPSSPPARRRPPHPRSAAPARSPGTSAPCRRWQRRRHPGGEDRRRPDERNGDHQLGLLDRQRSEYPHLR